MVVTFYQEIVDGATLRHFFAKGMVSSLNKLYPDFNASFIHTILVLVKPMMRFKLQWLNTLNISIKDLTVRRLLQLIIFQRFFRTRRSVLR